MSSDFVREQIEQSSGENGFRNKNAESALLGYVLTGKANVEDIVSALTHDDFAYGGFNKIFCAIENLVAAETKVDITTIGAEIAKLYSAGTEAKLSSALIELSRINFLYRHKNVEEWIQIIKSLSVRRKAIDNLSKQIGNLRDPTKEIGEVLAEIEKEVLSVDTGEAKWTKGSEVALATYNYLEKRQKGEIPAITSGITGIDKIIGGFFGGELTVVAARPSVGKSAFGLNIAMCATDKGYKVCFVSCEMTDTGFGQRMLSREAWVDGEVLRKAEMADDDWDRLATAMSIIGDLPIEFMFPKDNPNGMTLENVANSIRKKARRKEVDMLIVDYIGILQTERKFKDDRDRVKYITSELKKLSVVANIPVIALCQVNRDAHGIMPTMAQVRDSGSVEQDADGMIFLHRPENNRDPTIHPDDVARFDKMSNNGTVYLSVSIAKQRNGRTGLLNLIFDPKIMRYAEIARMEEQKA